MINFRLRCYNDHEFDAWFRDSQSYHEQQAQNLVACPTCGICDVTKAITAPKILKRRDQQEPSKVIDKSLQEKEILKRVNAYITQNFENVGEDFTLEVRKIAKGESDPKGIYGTAKAEDVQELHDEGIDVFIMPTPPKNDA